MDERCLFDGLCPCVVSFDPPSSVPSFRRISLSLLIIFVIDEAHRREDYGLERSK